jgi:hypothetical protein
MGVEVRLLNQMPLFPSFVDRCLKSYTSNQDMQAEVWPYRTMYGSAGPDFCHWANKVHFCYFWMRAVRQLPQCRSFCVCSQGCPAKCHSLVCLSEPCTASSFLLVLSSLEIILQIICMKEFPVLHREEEAQ